MRFRKSLKLAPGIKINVGKKGISTTVGGKGLSVTNGARGTFVNTSIPGTGISSRKKISSGKQAATVSTELLLFKNADLLTKRKSGYGYYVAFMVGSIIMLFINIIIGLPLLFLSILLLVVWINSRAGKSCSQIRKSKSAWQLGDITKSIEHLNKANDLYPNPLLMNPDSKNNDTKTDE